MRTRNGVTAYRYQDLIAWQLADEFKKTVFALASLAESELHLKDGIELKYFTADDCAVAFRFAKRCTVASSRLKRSQLARIARRRSAPRTGRTRST